MNKIMIQDIYWNKIKSHFYDDSREHSLFLFARSIKTKSGTVFLTCDIYPISDEKFVNKGLDIGYRLDHSELSNLVQKAKQGNFILIDIHNHFNAHPTFSDIDISSRTKALSYFYQQLSTNLHGSIVLGKDNTVDAIFWKDGKINHIDKILIQGEKMQLILPTHTSINLDDDTSYLERTQRQTLAFGVEEQKRLKNLTIGIIGLGGIGSIICQELAYLGIRNFILIDGDKVECKNLNRLVGANTKSIGKFKVDVIKSHIDFITDDQANVVAIPQNIETPDSFDEIKNSDFIFCCAETALAKRLTNKICNAFLIPFIGCWVGINQDTKNRLTNVGGNITFHNLTNPCLECLELIKDGDYLNNEPTPSVIHLNGTVSSLAIIQFHAYLSGWKPLWPFIQFDAVNTKILEIPNTKFKNCLLCSYVGLGDDAKILQEI